MPLATVSFPPLKIALAATAAGALEAGLPVLGGDALERLFPDAVPAGRSGALALFRQGAWLLGGATISARNLEESAHGLYTDIFRAARGLHLSRIWQYVPAIAWDVTGAVFCALVWRTVWPMSAAATAERATEEDLSQIGRASCRERVYGTV